MRQYNMQKRNPLIGILKDDANLSDKIYKHTVMFAFTARSGSTAITDAIAGMGMARRIEEIFNPRGPVQKLYDHYGGRDIIEFINNIYKHTMLTDAMVFKTDYSDLNYVIKEKDIYTLFPNLKIVYIERKDKILQAVSLYKAIVTSQWHQKKIIRKQKVSNNHSPDINKIISLKNRLQSDCEKWEKYFELIGVQPYKMYYEDFDNDHDGSLKNIFRYVTGDRYVGEIEQNYKKLRDGISEEWASKVRHELNK